MSPAPRLRLPVLLLALAAAALTVAAGLMLFSTFMLYDDEGYVLLSLRNFSEHGHLYGGVYTQYGPLPYVLYDLLHRLGLPFTHTAGRCLTLAAWSGAATLLAALVWRVTRHSACMLAVLSSVFVYLWIMVSEPNHPGGLAALLLAVLATFGYRWLAAGRGTAWAVLAGAGAAALLLTKINLGAFALLSAAGLLLLHHPRAGARRAMPWLIAAGLVLLPLALMRPLLGAPWVQTYALTFAFAAIPVAFALGRGAALAAGPDAAPARATPLRPRCWLAALAGGAAVAVPVLGVILARGTTLAELAAGLVLGPLRHPGHFSLVFPWPPGVLTLGSASLGLFLLGLAATRLGRPSRLALDTGVAVLRLVAAAALALALWGFPLTSPDNAVFAYALPCLWLFLWPLTGEEPAAVLARSWLGLLFLGQWLHAYPVPGSQIAWGTFLALPLAAIGGWQAAGWLAERHGRILTFARVQALDLLLTLGLVILAVFSGNRLAQIGARYLDSRSLALPGAEALRLPDSTTALYRLLAVNADAHSDLVFSLPGMFSLNLWSDRPTPTLTNVTHWFSLLDEPQQRAMIAALERHPRACVIVQQEHLDFLRQRGLAPAGPLYEYVMGQFTPAFAIDGFQFRVRRGRTVAPLLTAEVFTQPAPAAGQPPPAGPDTLVRMQLLLPADAVVASVELATMDDRRIPPLVLQGGRARVEVTPIGLDGVARGPAEARTFPFTLRGPSEVALYFDRGGRGISTTRSYLIVRTTAGAELALVRLRP